MELKETATMMASKNYKERFKAEYYQTEIRLKKLRDTIEKAKHGTLDFQITCPLELLKMQEHRMAQYLSILKIRAAIEEVGVEGGATE